MNNKGNLTKERAPLLPVIVGTGLGSGFCPWGPGTAGSAAATLVWLAIARWGGLDAAMLSLTTLTLVVAFTILGTWATKRLQPFWGEDPSRVVIDEWVGVWIPLSLLQLSTPLGKPVDSPWWVLVAFVLFRFFDMVKPLGIKALDKRKGAFFVMLDDIVGGVYAAIAMMAIKIVVSIWAK